MRGPTGIVPATTFDREPVYRPGQEPGPDEITERVERWFAPYHTALEREVQRHEVAIVHDQYHIVSNMMEPTL